MNKRYLEIDSSYRNRREFPNPSNFSVLISQTGTRDASKALDPVCSSSPLVEWTPSNILSGQVIDDVNNNSTRILISFPDIQPIQPLTSPVNNRIDYYAGLPVTINGENSTVFNSEYVSGTLYWIRLETSLNVIPSGGDIVTVDPAQIADIPNGLFWVPSSFNADNIYSETILWNDTTETFASILSYDGGTHTIGVDPSDLAGWAPSDNIVIRPERPALIDQLPAQAGAVLPDILISSNSSNEYQFYNGSFIRFVDGVNAGITCRIVNYTGNLTVKPGTGIPQTPFHPAIPAVPLVPYTVTINCDKGVNLTQPLAGDRYEILQFSRDNAVPFTYTGSLVSQQEMVCYEISLINLILPNITLESGGRSAFYPYFYVELQNISSASAGNKDIIYSNNPNAKRMLFRAPISDTTNPLTSPFVKIRGDGMVQTVKFKPNDSFRFGVYLSSGEPFETVEKDRYSPSVPNPLVQISAVFSLKRL